MPEEKAHPAALESWKQIAGYLNRSERTVRRWETDEGLPVHRHGHHKQDTVFARVDEIDKWIRQRTRKAGHAATAALPGSDSAEAVMPRGSLAAANAYLAEHDAITRTIDCYITSGRAGNSDLMRPAFHPDATMAGYCQGLEYSGSIEHLFDWINANGPAPDINPRFARIEIFETIAIVHLEVQGWSGRLAGADSSISEVFSLLKREGQWLITQKTFHWHDT